MITVNNLSVYFSGEALFKDIHFVVGDNDKVGLVGKNGAGKTTLLKVIAGQQAFDTGSMVITKGHRIGYLPQETIIETDKTVWEETLTAFSEERKIEKQIDDIVGKISEIEDYASSHYLNLVEKLNDLNQQYDYLEGNQMEANTEKVLLGLGFMKSDFNRKLKEFSSGWQMRVALAKILLQKPEIMLLDEPTNHLDIESIQWLESFLHSYQGIILLVSHDRAFLNKIGRRTIEITFGRIEDYNCNYSTYVERRLERISHQKQVYENQQKEIEAIEQFIERFRYKATKAKQVQSRVKMLDKMDIIEVEEVDTSKIRFLFPPAPNCNRVVFEAENLEKKYGEKTVLQNVAFAIENKEKVAFVGKNGEGKTTLMRIFHQELDATSGKLNIGTMVKIGYYAQNQNLLLDAKKTVFQTLDDIAVGDVRTKIRGILGSFLFSNEDIEKKVSVLSGGEKARLALAKLLLEPYNVLLLDEPTNHLDMQSKDVLKNALLRYNGTLVIVSHDRDFLQGLTDKVFEFKNKSVKIHLGDIEEYLSKQKMDSLQMLNKRIAEDANPTNFSQPNSKDQWEKQKEKESRIRKVTRQIENLEKKIEQLEEEIKQINVLLNNPEPRPDSFSLEEHYKQYEKKQKDLEQHINLWEEQTLLLETLKEN